MDTMWWISWEQTGYDPRPTSWPPPREAIAFWETGSGSGFVCVVALVRATSESAAKDLIASLWGDGICSWRFCRAFDPAAPPGDRFPPPKWAVEDGRWPWPVPGAAS